MSGQNYSMDYGVSEAGRAVTMTAEDCGQLMLADEAGPLPPSPMRGGNQFG
jgi:hypothetical protein